MSLPDQELLEVVLELEKVNSINGNDKYLPHIRILLCDYLEIEDSYDIIPMTNNPNSYVKKRK